LLAGCGSDRSPARPQHGQSSSAPRPGGAAPPADADLNDAVSASSGTALFKLKFKLNAGPVVGQPGTLELVVVPASGVKFDRVHLSLRPGDGLRLLSSSNLDSAETAAGEQVSYQVTLLPDTAGVLTLGVTVLVDAESNSLTRVYTIPVIAVPAAG
jgi:hypothetical protein